MNKELAKELAIVDALAALAATGPAASLGPILGPYAILWAGFEASRMAESTLRPAYEKKNLIIPRNTGSDNFSYGQLGNFHNDLMVKASEAKISAAAFNGHLNNDFKALLIDNHYYGEGDLEKLCNQNEATMIGIQQYTNGYVLSGSVDVISMVDNYSPLSSNVKSVLQAINNGIINIGEGDLSNYLLEIENVVKSSNDLQVDDKYKILLYIGVLNSSAHLWISNDWGL